MSLNALLSLRVLTPDGLILEETSLTSINIPLVAGGNIGIRPGHAPLIAETALGRIKYRKNKEQFEVQFHSGIVNIRNNVVLILTAGKVSETNSFQEDTNNLEYERLMQSLLEKITPEKR